MLSIYFLTTCPWQRDVQYGVEYGPRWRRLEGGDDALFDWTDILYWNGSSRYLGEKKNLVMGLICLTRSWWCFQGRIIPGCAGFWIRGRFAVNCFWFTRLKFAVRTLILLSFEGGGGGRSGGGRRDPFLLLLCIGMSFSFLSCPSPFFSFSIKDSSTCKGCFIFQSWSQSSPLREFSKACHFIRLSLLVRCVLPSLTSETGLPVWLFILRPSPPLFYRNRMPVNDFQELGVFIQSWP